ncbi:MAG TPA: MIP/aquaporin family protein [Kofleriaceae bacterium]|jgi:glycerol uptake facilitator-like aquaporin|nr:MIP/aquaporin family protein [Kofleriaceae bacterium]
MTADLTPRRLAGEAIGTALLVTAVIGSGIMAQRLTGDRAVALLANTVATGGALVAILLIFGPISGAHLNPAVTLSMVALKQQTSRSAVGYIAAQIAGGITGAILANTMFELSPITWSMTTRTGVAKLLSESVATFGLMGVVIAVGRTRAQATPFAVAAYIVAAYWFTASTSFANPAVTIARAFSDTFAGIRPVDVGGFLVAQAVGASLGAWVFSWLVPIHGSPALSAD